MTSVATYSQVLAVSNPQSDWLKRYYGARALFSVIWVALAFSVGSSHPDIAAVLLVVYPLWDAAANVFDGKRNGGLRSNPTQLINAGISAIVTIAVATTVERDVHIAIGVIGVWAALSGILQLATGVRRWRETSAQWPQILSGAQSCLAAAHIIGQATDSSVRIGVTIVAPYAAFGALYFAISAALLTWKRA